MRSIVLVAFLALISLSISGCSVNPATGQQNFTGLMSSEKELQVGRSEHPKILQKFGGTYNHKKLEAYVDTLGQRLASKSELPNLKWTFSVLDDPIINAFALPGGYIYISRGLIALAENEAELAAVLGHEIGHVTARHTAQRYSKSVLTDVGATLFGIIIGGPAGDIANYAGQAYLAGYSRSHEIEADMLGMRYMTKLGYNPKASASFFKKLAAHTELSARMKGGSGEQGHYSIFASHPDTQSRVIASQKIAKTYPANLTLLQRVSYLNQIDDLVYGDNANKGLIKGQTFIHPGLRIKFNVPQGFTYTNKPTFVAATHNNGSAIVFDMGEPHFAQLPMKRYLKDVWASKYKLRELESLRIDGKFAATATVRLKTSKGVRNIRYIAIVDKGQIFRFRFLTPTHLTSQMQIPLRDATYSFKRISRREAQNIKGHHIAIHKVRQGETISTLANKMRINKLKIDWFKVLNREQLLDGLQTGESVKLIAQ